jgi:hypothetical protein
MNQNRLFSQPFFTSTAYLVWRNIILVADSSTNNIGINTNYLLSESKYPPKQHVVKACEGHGRKSPRILDLGIRWNLEPASLSGRFISDTSGPRSGQGALPKRKIPVRNWTRVAQHVASQIKIKTRGPAHNLSADVGWNERPATSRRDEHRSPWLWRGTIYRMIQKSGQTWNETHMDMGMTAFWDVGPCSLVEVGRYFTGAYCSETSVYLYEATRRNIPEGCHLHTRRHENLKSHTYEHFFFTILNLIGLLFMSALTSIFSNTYKNTVLL